MIAAQVLEHHYSLELQSLVQNSHSVADARQPSTNSGPLRHFEAVSAGKLADYAEPKAGKPALLPGWLKRHLRDP